MALRGCWDTEPLEIGSAMQHITQQPSRVTVLYLTGEMPGRGTAMLCGPGIAPEAHPDQPVPGPGPGPAGSAKPLLSSGNKYCECDFNLGVINSPNLIGSKVGAK